MKTRPILNLWLLVALACLVAFAALPFGTLAVAADNMQVVCPLYAYNFWGLAIPLALAILFAAFGGFTRHIHICKSIASLTCLMEIVTIGITAYIFVDKASQGTLEWSWTIALAVAALLLTILAIAGINSDIRKVRNADRLR